VLRYSCCRYRHSQPFIAARANIANGVIGRFGRPQSWAGHRG
jgi:predicted dehydrogenase